MARISKERQEEIRKSIKSVARKLFSEIGFNEVSTKMIAKEVGIAEGTLFNYFDSKTEIFFEAFGDEYAESRLHDSSSLELNEQITEVLVGHFQKSMKMALRLPRGIMSELAIATIKMARKKPERFKRLMEYDLQFIQGIEEYVDRLKERHLLNDVDSKLFSEIIFSVIGYELLYYIYETNIEKDQMFKNITKKIDLLVKGYAKGGNQ